MKTWMKFIITFIKTTEVPFWRLLAGSPAISNTMMNSKERLEQVADICEVYALVAVLGNRA
jgi:hypothetical protein